MKKENSTSRANDDEKVNSVSTGHWTTVKFSKDMLMDALIKHVLGLMSYGMSDLGEVLEIVQKLKESDEERWISEWSAMAQRLQDRGEKAELADNSVSASTAYLRASTYWRVSLMYFSHSEDTRIQDYALSSATCYKRYLELSEYPGEYVKIPYEDTFLPGHFYRSPFAGDNGPLLVITPGRDTWAEDTRWVYDGAIRRGINCLIYDGPGQGFALRLNHLHFRNDWENVVKPVIDFAVDIPGIDPSRIGLMGLSFGGFLAPRAAAFEKRIKVLVADPGNISWGDGIIKVLEKVNGLPLEELPPSVSNLVKDYAWKHGVQATVKDVIQTLKAYDNTPIVGDIECETLVMDGTEEVARGQAEKLYNALNCKKHYMLFDETSTAQAHCQIGGYATATEYLFDWIEKHL